MVQTSPSGYPWHGSLRDLATIITSIRHARAFGRLTLRNTVRLGIAHLYFRGGRLVHMVSNRGDAQATLTYLQEWTKATIRFERGVSTTDENIAGESEYLLDTLILDLQRRGVVQTPEMPRIVEGGLIATSTGDQLIAPQEWRMLIEGTRRVSLAVAHLIGPREALSVLRDILDDCSAAFPAFSALQIASSGYLQVEDTSQLDHMSRAELFEGFAALIAICEHFCSPIIGEDDAHRLIVQALGDVGPALMSLGVFK